MEVNREQVECGARLAGHCHRQDDYEKELTPGFESNIALLMIFLLFGLGFTLADRVVDCFYYGGGE